MIIVIDSDGVSTNINEIKTNKKSSEIIPEFRPYM